MPKFIELNILETGETSKAHMSFAEVKLLNTETIFKISKMVVMREDLEKGTIPYPEYVRDQSPNYGDEFYDCAFVELTDGSAIATQETYATLRDLLNEDIINAE